MARNVGVLLACFAAGCYVASLLEGAVTPAGGPAPWEEGNVRGAGADLVGLTQEVASSKEGNHHEKPWAYVLLAYDEPERPMGDFLWGALALARALRQFTQHHIVLLTNHRKFVDGTPVDEVFDRLGVEVRPVQMVFVPEHKDVTQRFRFAYSRILAWNLTDFERVVWLDSDVAVYRNIDWLFEREGTWAARDDWFCKLNQNVVNTGVVALTPDKKDFLGLYQHARAFPAISSHEVVASYFKEKKKTPINLLSDLEARFGRCLGADVASPYVGPDGSKTNGLWSVPAIIHKSGGFGDLDDGIHDNVCFQPNATKQRYFVGKAVLNACHFHTLGAYWRYLFCAGALKDGRLKLPMIMDYCDDRCYWWGGDVPGRQCGKPVDATPDIHEYWAHVRGVPAIDATQQ